MIGGEWGRDMGGEKEEDGCEWEGSGYGEGRGEELNGERKERKG